MDELEKIMQAAKAERLKLEEADREEADLQAQIERIKRSQKQQSRKVQSMRTHKFCVFAGAFFAESAKLLQLDKDGIYNELSATDKEMEDFGLYVARIFNRHKDG